MRRRGSATGPGRRGTRPSRRGSRSPRRRRALRAAATGSTPSSRVTYSSASVLTPRSGSRSMLGRLRGDRTCRARHSAAPARGGGCRRQDARAACAPTDPRPACRCAVEPDRARTEHRRRPADASFAASMRRRCDPVGHVGRALARRSGGGGCWTESCGRTRPEAAWRRSTHAPMNPRLTAAVPRSASPSPSNMKNPCVARPSSTAPTASATRLTTMSMALLIWTRCWRSQRQVEQLVGRLVERESEPLVERIGQQDTSRTPEQQDQRAAAAERQRQHEDRDRQSEPPQHRPDQQQLQHEARRRRARS